MNGSDAWAGVTSSDTSDVTGPRLTVDTAVVMCMLSLFGVVGTVGNTLVLYVYNRKRNKVASSIFILSLATIDLVTSLVVMPYVVVCEFLNYKLRYDLACKLYAFLITFNVPYSFLTMVAIAVDRYICICHPHCHFLDARRAKITIVCLGVMAFLFGLVTALSVGVYTKMVMRTPRPCGSGSGGGSGGARGGFPTNSTFTDLEEGICWNCTSSQALEECFDERVVLVYNGTCLGDEILITGESRRTYQKIYAVTFLISLVIVMVLYVLIYRAVINRRARKMRRNLSLKDLNATNRTGSPENNSITGASTTNNSCTEHNRTRAKRHPSVRERYWLGNIRTALMLFIVTAVFVVTYLPSWLMALKLISLQKIVFFLYFGSHVSNPFIYAFMNPAFRKELKKISALLRCRKSRY